MCDGLGDMQGTALSIPVLLEKEWTLSTPFLQRLAL